MRVRTYKNKKYKSKQNLPQLSNRKYLLSALPRAFTKAPYSASKLTETAMIEDKKPFDKRKYGFIRVRKGWNVREKKAGPTKAGYWRNVPVSSEFYWFLIHDLRVETMNNDDYLFPRSWEWDQGMQASFPCGLRGFCQANHLPSVRFHTLRACFATQLISTGIPATVVMKICGWLRGHDSREVRQAIGLRWAGAHRAT